MALEANLFSQILLGDKAEDSTERTLFHHFQSFALLMMLKDHVAHQPKPGAYATALVETWRKIILTQHLQDMKSLAEVRASPMGKIFADLIDSEQEAQEKLSAALGVVTEALMALLIPEKE